MYIEKRYLDNIKGEPDQVFGSLEEVKKFYEKRDERPEWIEFFISQLEKNGKANDRFAEYKIVYENGDTVTVLPEIFSI